VTCLSLPPLRPGQSLRLPRPDQRTAVLERGVLSRSSAELEYTRSHQGERATGSGGDLGTSFGVAIRHPDRLLWVGKVGHLHELSLSASSPFCWPKQTAHLRPPPLPWIEHVRDTQRWQLPSIDGGSGALVRWVVRDMLSVTVRLVAAHRRLRRPRWMGRITRLSHGSVPSAARKQSAHSECQACSASDGTSRSGTVSICAGWRQRGQGTSGKRSSIHPL
jgi:hypothetical protein